MRFCYLRHLGGQRCREIGRRRPICANRPRLGGGSSATICHPLVVEESPYFQTSESYRQRVHKEGFRSWISVQLHELGGSAGSDRHLIYRQAMSQVPMPNEPPLDGTFYHFYFKANYPGGPAYEEVYVELERGGWRILGFYFALTSNLTPVGTN